MAKQKEVPLKKQVSFWHKFATNHEAFGRKRVKDTKMCIHIIKNKKIFSKFIDTGAGGFSADVSGRRLDCREDDDNSAVYYCAQDCFGSDAPGYFTYGARKMTHLSQFLASLAAYQAKKNK